MNEAPIPVEEMRRVIEWYQKSQIDYVDAYLKLYISYNAWYQRATGLTNDREALGMLKKRFIIWDDYLQGRTMQDMRPYLERLVEFTQREPLSTRTTYWNGYLHDATDWKGLIEYWYQVRCLIVHGGKVRQRDAWYAYETLDAFMREIVRRIHACVTTADLKAIVSRAGQAPDTSNRFTTLQQKLYQKYIVSPNIWEVDMQRASNTP